MPEEDAAAMLGKRSARLCARDIMTSPVRTASPQATVRELAALMTEHRISGVPIVTAAGELVGIVTEGDLLYKEVQPRPVDPPAVLRRLPIRYAVEASERARKAGAVYAFEVMSSPVLTVQENTSVHEISRLMITEDINRLPVMRAGRVVGIVSRADVLQALLRSDAEIAESVRSSLLQDLWVDVTTMRIEVTGGVVTLDGQVERRSEKELAGKWAQMIDGVVEVHNRLTYELDDRQIKPESPRR